LSLRHPLFVRAREAKAWTAAFKTTILAPEMIGKWLREGIVGCAMFALASALGAAQSMQSSKSPSAKQGALTYKQYCAVCHGSAGKGDGPAASALKVRPPDLTTLARRHGGKFPDAYVSSVLRNGVKMDAHGTPEMPIWGPLFLALDSSFQSETNRRIAGLAAYLKSLQTK
jgi:mono/diheme cytochrome c family protein